MTGFMALTRPDLRDFSPYVSARREARAGRVWLNANESPWAPDDQADGLNRYPDPQPAGLRERLAALYGLTPDRLLVTRGSDEAMDVLCRGFCRPGRDAVAVTPPTFGMYQVCARLQGAAVKTVPLVADDGFALDVDALLAACRDSVKLVFLCSPNNPTGNLLDDETVLAVCRALAGRALVVLDEAYREFADGPGLVGSAGRPENLVVLRTLSKARALAGARVGVLAGAPELVRWLEGLLPPYPLPAPSVRCAEQALAPAGERAARERIAMIRKQRERVARRLAAMPLVETVHPSDANFLLVRLTEPERAARALEAAGVVLRDVSGQPGLERCVRITIGTPEENDAMLAALAGA